MRIAALAAARARAAIFTVRATRLAWSTGADLDRLELGAGLEDSDPDDDPEGYLRLMVEEIGLDVCEAKLAAREGSEWDVELRALAGGLGRLGIDAAPALRWRGELYTGLVAISGVLAESESRPAAVDTQIRRMSRAVHVAGTGGVCSGLACPHRSRVVRSKSEGA